MARRVWLTLCAALAALSLLAWPLPRDVLDWQPGLAAAQPWRLDSASARLIAPNQGSVPLTSRELELLRRLMAADGGLVGKSDLVQAMGYADEEEGFHRIQSQLTRLRRKTMEALGMALPVRAVFGKGLVFVNQP